MKELKYSNNPCPGCGGPVTISSRRPRLYCTRKCFKRAMYKRDQDIVDVFIRSCPVYTCLACSESSYMCSNDYTSVFSGDEFICPLCGLSSEFLDNPPTDKIKDLLLDHNLDIKKFELYNETSNILWENIKFKETILELMKNYVSTTAIDQRKSVEYQKQKIDEETKKAH